ncbi:hypothetical protein VPH184E373B_0052 [Vibrio phage 184E37-3b]|nr:hypothetical protein MYOV056v2_p0045 [Vibrio phage 184E37.3a]QZI90009.1 hypothetical protein MYOV057v1_p0094 [Vibrio phage 184E37.1]
MSELFNNLKSALLEAIESCKQGYDETSSDEHSEELEWHECDGMTACPNEPSDDVEEELEQNMLLRDLGRGGE